ncbi:HNH endonuclease signature motif containing protein [Actinomadura sp. 7K507]|uniref:HNH endonuclease signature motif containing protein n=1 Tax=Actinomadura sp. 7K507 TaxID=2530365 RepID=UPI0010478A1A|nr:HNH endonuclease signature motif containing protein [Actinomadura sp. 7K507]TDC95614.1 HNH endonuclease [Actinomadura sp. 7K507]
MCSTGIDVASMSTTQLVDAAATIASELAQRDAPAAAAVCMQDTETLARATDLHESFLATLIGRVDAAGEMRRWGYPSTRSWLRTSLGLREARAKERIALARERDRLPEVTKRLASGNLPHGYAATIAAAVTRLNDQDCKAAEEILLGLTAQGFSAGKVAAFGNRITDLIAERDGTETPDADTRRGYERTWIDSTRSLDGGRFIKGWLNAEDAAIWDGTLAPLAKPAGIDDRRDLSERTAAALMNVLSGGHRATKVTVICDLDTLTGGTAPARLTDGTPIPAEQARRIALNAGVSPLILGRGSIPLYLGYRHRFASPGQRQVLEALYPTCAVKGCEVPGTGCEVDHVHGWALGNSPTNIDELALTCGWHNRKKHANPAQMHIAKGRDGRYVYRVLPPDEARTGTTPQTTDIPGFLEPEPRNLWDAPPAGFTTHRIQLRPRHQRARPGRARPRGQRQTGGP